MKVKKQVKVRPEAGAKLLKLASKYCLNEKEITAGNIHINEAEIILENNLLSLPRLKEKTRLTPHTSLEQNKNQALSTSSQPLSHPQPLPPSQD